VVAQLQCPGYKYYCEQGPADMQCSTEEAIPGFAVPAINVIDYNAVCIGTGADPCEQIAVQSGINANDMFACENKGIYCCIDFGVPFNPSPPPPSPSPPPRASPPPKPPSVVFLSPPIGGGGGGGGSSIPPMQPMPPQPPMQANGCRLTEFYCERSTDSMDSSVAATITCFDSTGALVDKTDCLVDPSGMNPEACFGLTWSSGSTHNPGGNAQCYYLAPMDPNVAFNATKK
jgi:hypothetical protein